jgi:hypothetical protein
LVGPDVFVASKVAFPVVRYRLLLESAAGAPPLIQMPP